MTDRGQFAPVRKQVGLALRAFRRSRGWSQRAFADAVGVPASTVARMERDAAAGSLRAVEALLRHAGYTLGIVDADGVLVREWDETDRLAKDRSGRRFPANRVVRRVDPRGIRPLWWTAQEYLGTGECGSQPGWTAEGFPTPVGTRYGKKPRSGGTDDSPRWPNLPPAVPSVQHCENEEDSRRA